MKRYLALAVASAIAAGSDLPVTKVILYKNGVAYYERAGQAPGGAPARLEFKISEMDDVLKSLIVEDRGGAVARVRYDQPDTAEDPICVR